MLRELKRFFVGNPLSSREISHQRLSKRRALAVFSSDALSSVAYATDEILAVLIMAGTLALHWSIPMSLTIIILLFMVVLSYQQTIHEYPNGGGAYIVAKENLGVSAGLLAGAALLVDYVLTVAVSISAAVAAMSSAFPWLYEHKVAISLLFILCITVANLRGIRESSTIFALPTYLFVISMLVLISFGIYKIITHQYEPLPKPLLKISHELDLFLILKAFSSGCTAMTGVEAISNGVPAFEPPESKNASITLVIMALLLGFMFVGTSSLAFYFGAIPQNNETVLSQIARVVFSDSPFYYIIQCTTTLILVLAANTSYADFPRLSSLLAKDRFLPRQLASMGDRLVFSNGILLLGLFSAGLIILFGADTHSLIPLYAVGVFLSFTLSQAGMVIHWLREKQPGWTHRLALNAVGAVLCFVVFSIFVITKFIHGAWAVIIILPALMYAFRQVHEHYIDVGGQLNLQSSNPENFWAPVRHTVLLPVSGVHRGVLEALRYARSISDDVRAVYVEIDPRTTERIQKEWTRWSEGTPLVVLKSPYRSVIRPFLDYVDELDESLQNDLVTIIIPEFVPSRWWHQFLHNQTAIFLKAALTFKKGKVVTSVRYHLH